MDREIRILRVLREEKDWEQDKGVISATSVFYLLYHPKDRAIIL